MKRKNFSCFLFILPSLLGVLLFYTIPFLFSLYYALIDNMEDRNLVGLQNFAQTLANPLFRRALGNTAFFMVLAVPLSMALGLALAICLQKLRRGRAIATLVLLIPLVVPSGTIVYFWKVLFDANGLVRELLLLSGVPHESLSRYSWPMGVLVLIFLWKNVSYNIVLFWSGLNWIPKTYYEQMELEGAGPWRRFTGVTWVYLSPTTFVVLLMSIVNSFKVFKEVYLLYGNYPSPKIYMLQHYMNNQFLMSNMQKLSSAAYILFLLISLILLAVWHGQKRVADSLQ